MSGDDASEKIFEYLIFRRICVFKGADMTNNFDKEMPSGQIHHVEYYVDDLERTQSFWGWLFGLLGWQLRTTWSNGIDWVYPATGSYLVFARTTEENRNIKNNRRAAGLNHLAFSYSAPIPQSELVLQLIDHGARIVFDEGNYICFEDPNQFAVELYLTQGRLS